MNKQDTLTNKPTNQFLSTLLLLSGPILLVSTWSIILLMLLAATEGWLAPWDTQRFRPPTGTWERYVNDLFEVLPGSVLPALLIILTSVTLYTYRVIKTQERITLTWTFAIANIVFVIVNSVLVSLAQQLPDLWLSQPRPLFDVGYHRTWPSILVTVLLLILLFMAQAKASFNRS
jgi:hypothetical protein